MKRALMLLLLLNPAWLHAQDDTITLPDVINGAQQWAEENLDTNFLNSLPQVDESKSQQFLRDLQKQFQGEYVIDLAALRDTAQTVLPLLEAHPDTQPYAAWLRPRIDYLQVADELRLLIPSPPPGYTNQPPRIPTPPVNPPADKERTIWINKVANRPWPDAAKDYVPKLKPIFLAQKVPAELVWIAEAESSFDPRARSPAGAAGMFQLMPDTAKGLGLSVGLLRDERLQPEPSARASAQYLKKLHDRFGDWRLALAAYNAGEGTVQRLLDRHQTRSYDKIATRLPAETQMYVPKVEAILFKREGVELAKLGAF